MVDNEVQELTNGCLLGGKCELMVCWLRNWYNLSWSPPQYWLDYVVSIMSLISLLYSSPCWILNSLLKILFHFCISVIICIYSQLNMLSTLKNQCLYYSFHIFFNTLFQFSLFFNSVIFCYYFDSFLNVFIHLKIFILCFVSHLCTIFLMLLGLYSFWLLDP